MPPNEILDKVNIEKSPEQSSETIKTQEQVDASLVLERPVEAPPDVFKKEGRSGEGASAPSTSSAGAPVPSVVKSPEIRQIETLLAENFKDIFIKLPPNIKNDFKKRGELAAAKISQLLAKGEPRPKSILDIIRDWLATLGKIAGINRFFLEQQAKIKTDQILDLKKHKNKDSQDKTVKFN